MTKFYLLLSSWTFLVKLKPRLFLRVTDRGIFQMINLRKYQNQNSIFISLSAFRFEISNTYTYKWFLDQNRICLNTSREWGWRSRITMKRITVCQSTRIQSLQHHHHHPGVCQRSSARSWVKKSVWLGWEQCCRGGRPLCQPSMSRMHGAHI